MTDYKRKGWVSAAEGEIWLRQWSTRISPKKVCLFGGEPFLNRELAVWIKNVRRHWPSAVIKIITNGFYLDKIPIIDMLDGPSELQVSLHFRDEEHKPRVISSLMETIGRSGRRFNIVSKQSKYEKLRLNADDIDIIIAEFGEFRKPYKGYGKEMLPSQGKPSDSHARCGSPNNPILYDNRLYKCGPIANLNDTLKQLGNDKPEWGQYLQYKGLRSTDDLQDFIDHINKPEWICSMCPDDDSELIDHYAEGSVMVKKK